MEGDDTVQHRERSAVRSSAELYVTSFNCMHEGEEIYLVSEDMYLEESGNIDSRESNYSHVPEQ